MSEFEVKAKQLKRNVDDEKKISKKINRLSKEISSVAKKIQLDPKAERAVKRNLEALAKSNESNAAKITRMAVTLKQIAAYYEQTEQKISGQDSGHENIVDEIKQKISDLVDKVRKIGEWLGLDDSSFFSDDPVNLSNGNYVYEKNFFNYETILPVNFRFFYNVKSKKAGSLGKGWLHNYECCIYRAEDSLRVMQEDGAEEIFVENEGVWLACPGTFGELRQEDDCYVYTDEEGHISRFALDGKLLSKMTKDGWSINLHYVEERLRSVDCTDDISFALSYDGDRLTQITDQAGRMVHLAYENDNLATVTDPNGNVTKYEYDEKGYLCKVITPLNHVGLWNEFDSQGRTVLQTFPDGGQVKYQYNDLESSVTMIRQNGEKIEYVHDARYRNTKVIYPDGEETITFNENNRKTSFVDKLGNKTLYDYDERGRLTGITNALGNKLQLSYNAEGQTNEVFYDGICMSSCEFDEFGRQKATINAKGFRVEFEYDELGRVTENVHEDGSITRLDYDKSGNIVCVEDPVTGTTKYEYDECHRVIRTVDALGNETKYAYDADDNLTEVTDADGKKRYYEYDAQGNLTRIEDFNHGIISIEYNVMNKPVHVTDADGNSTWYEYDLMSNLTKITDADGNVTSYQYDQQNRKTKIVYPSGGEETAVYDAGGNLKKRIAQDGGEYHFEYDALNRPVKITDPVGGTRSAVFDNKGNVTDIFYEDGSEEHFQFDLMGNRVLWQDKIGYKRYYSYDALNNLIEIRDDTGILAEYTYLAGGKILTEKCINGAEVSYQYDAVGNIIQANSSTEGIWKFGYDCLGRVTQIERENFGIERYEYDAVGNVTAVTDAQGNRSVFDYSAAGALLRVTDPNGVQTGYRYDGSYRLLDMIQPENGRIDIQKLNEYNRSQKDVRVTSYTRDASGNVTAVTDPEGNRAEYEYDLCGRIMAQKDEEGNVTRCTYRKDGTEEELSFQDGRRIKYQYDALKRLIQIEDWLGSTSFKRDSEGRLLHVTDHLGKSTEYEWSDRGECTKIVYPDGKKAFYEYDDALHLVRTQYENQTVQYGYYENGLRKERILSDGLSSSYKYDKFGNIFELCHFKEGKTLLKYQYFYDACGRKNRIIEEKENSADRTDNRFSYTALGSIASVERNGEKTEEYSYDAFGNRKEAFCNGNRTVYEYDRLNRLTASESVEQKKHYTYDRRGNLTGMSLNGIQKLTLHFDALNRLAGAKSDAGEASYEYNGLDMLTGVRKQIGGEIKRESYFYNYTRSFHNLLGLKNDSTERDYVWDQELLFESGMGGTSVFLNDERMNPICLLSDGSAQENYTYDIWGNQEKDAANITCNFAGFGFTGYRRDEITGYYYAGRRNYDSQVGRFIAQDPVAGSAYRPVTCNPFIYCIGDPVNRYDPTGAVAAWLASGIIGMVSNLAVMIGGDIANSVKNGRVTVSPWQDYVAAAAGGFVEGIAFVLGGKAGSKIAGAVGAATKTLISNGLKMLSGEEGYRAEDGYTVGKLFSDILGAAGKGAVEGFLFGKAGEYIKIPGLTKGRGNWDAVVRGKLTAAANGFVKNISAKTIGKGIVTQGFMKAIETAIGKIKSAIIDFMKKMGSELIEMLFSGKFTWPAAIALIFTGGRSAVCPAAGG